MILIISQVRERSVTYYFFSKDLELIDDYTDKNFDRHLAQMVVHEVLNH